MGEMEGFGLGGVEDVGKRGEGWEKRRKLEGGGKSGSGVEHKRSERGVDRRKEEIVGEGKGVRRGWRVMGGARWMSRESKETVGICGWLGMSRVDVKMVLH
jgi:hypothetical protein